MRRLTAAPWLAGGDGVALEVRQALASALFAADGALPASYVAVGLAGSMMTWRLGVAWPLIWMSLAVPVAIYRVTLDRRFRADPRTLPPETWVRRFAVGAWAMAALWGAAGVAMPLYHDSYANMLIMTVQVAFVAVSAARNNASPVVAVGQVLITEGCSLVWCLSTRDPFMICGSLFFLIYMASTLGTVRSLSRNSLRLLSADFDRARLLTDLNMANRELAQANERLGALANTDALTGLVNRRGFDQLLRSEWRRAVRDASELALIMVDVDYFKAYNDRYGHIAGDDCLRQVAALMAVAVHRAGDTTARFGGEEFAILLPGTGDEGASKVAELVRAAIQAVELPHAASPLGRLTISLGCASLRPDRMMTEATLLRLADTALYESKSLGRNRVRLHRPLVSGTASVEG